MLVDTAFVLLFAGVGRSSHAEGLSVAGVLTTAWPFLAGLVGAWLLASAIAGRRASQGVEAVALLPWGVAVPVVTWALGMGLRVVSGQGVSGGFPLVALGFLLVTLVGWRVAPVVARAAVRRAGPRRSAARAPGRPGRGD